MKKQNVFLAMLKEVRSDSRRPNHLRGARVVKRARHSRGVGGDTLDYYSAIQENFAWRSQRTGGKNGIRIT